MDHGDRAEQLQGCGLVNLITVDDRLMQVVLKRTVIVERNDRQLIIRKIVRCLAGEAIEQILIPVRVIRRERPVGLLASFETVSHKQFAYINEFSVLLKTGIDGAEYAASQKPAKSTDFFDCMKLQGSRINVAL